MADDVWQWCSKTGNSGRTITIKIKFGDFVQITRSRSFLRPVTQEDDIQKAVLELAHSVFPLRTGIRLVGVTLSGFDCKTAQDEVQPAFL